MALVGSEDLAQRAEFEQNARRPPPYHPTDRAMTLLFRVIERGTGLPLKLMTGPEFIRAQGYPVLSKETLGTSRCGANQS